MRDRALTWDIAMRLQLSLVLLLVTGSVREATAQHADHEAHARGATSDAAEHSQNWLMVMEGRPLAGGMFEARTMVSLEPLTLGDNGYALLAQTGETIDGMPLVDRQHPHDLWMELAGRYERPNSSDLAFQVYGALAGGPAVGPVAFPHRPSAMADPLAPLGHHWLDSTHIIRDAHALREPTLRAPDGETARRSPP